MANTPSTILITLDDVDITDDVVFRETSFQSQANPIQGSFKVVLRDKEHTFAPVAGQKLTCVIDGVPLLGGYLMRIGRGNFFPAVDTASPSTIPSRKWILQGPDYNVLWDKRIIYDASSPTVSPLVPSGKRTITKAFKHLMNNFIDVPAGLDFTTFVDTIFHDDGEEEEYGTEDGSLYVGSSKTLRKQMDDFADHSGIIYYIDADFKVHLHAYENILNPWIITDVTGVGGVRFRSGEYTEDFTRISTEAHVWGGSSIRRSDGGTGGDIVYARYPDPPPNGSPNAIRRETEAIANLAEFGLWQIGEERAGQANYLSQKSVNKRAKHMIIGPTGVVPTHGIESGFGQSLTRFDCTWYAHDVPGQAHIRPGYLQDIILYTQGSGGSPLVTRLPMRSMRISFPTLPTDNPGGQTYVEFTGEFGMAYSDSRFLWTFLKQSKLEQPAAVVLVDDESSAAPSGATANLSPIETPNGSIKAFTFTFTLFANQFSLYLNGLFQRQDIDFTYSGTTKQVTFLTAPGLGDQIWVTGFVSQ